MQKKAFLTLFLLILLTGFVISLNCPPSLPKIYSGQVYYKIGILGLGGEELLDEYEYPLRAMMNGEIVGEGKVIGGSYSIEIIPCSGASGDIIFVINGIKADTKGSYEGQDDWGKIVDDYKIVFNEEPPHEDTCGDNAIQLGEECDGINFGAINSCGEGWEGTISCTSACKISYVNCTYTTYTICGDGICNGGETCSTCSADCGTCPSGSTGGGGGGGGGGGSSSGGKTTTTTPIVLTSSGTNSNSSASNTQNLSKKTDESSSSPITGRSISNFSDFATSGYGITIVSLIILIIAFFVIRQIKLSKKK